MLSAIRLNASSARERCCRLNASLPPSLAQVCAALSGHAMAHVPGQTLSSIAA